MGVEFWGSFVWNKPHFSYVIVFYS
jgi:hypothetical protein